MDHAMGHGAWAERRDGWRTSALPRCWMEQQAAKAQARRSVLTSYTPLPHPRRRCGPYQEREMGCGGVVLSNIELQTRGPLWVAACNLKLYHVWEMRRAVTLDLSTPPVQCIVGGSPALCCSIPRSFCRGCFLSRLRIDLLSSTIAPTSYDYGRRVSKWG